MSTAPDPGAAGPEVFDVLGPLPTGTTVLEASAGTGKTWTIAALATRYVAEGVARLDQLMLVTFGRAATVELRERVRERLTSTADALADPAAARTSADPLLRHLATGDDATVEQRRDRLEGAVVSFDGATIATTHGFCHQVLAGLGVVADVDPDATFVDDLSDLVREVALDLYVRKWGVPDAPTGRLPLSLVTDLARQAVDKSTARLEPSDADPRTVAGVRHRLAVATREHVEQRKRERRVIDYDDLLVRLRDALLDPETGGLACERVRSPYSVVLVDEFQDTDPVQWQILEAAFHGHTTMVLIGDPKQAIYAFRGGDVVTYLRATEQADRTETLDVSWRSDEHLNDALRTLLGGVALGDPRIVVRDVSAAHEQPRLVDAAGDPVGAPLRIRVVRRLDESSVTGSGLLSVGAARPQVADDVAAEIARLLGSGSRLLIGPAASAVERDVAPGDVAVLVQRNADAVTVRDALRAAGVPAVLTGTSSVFLSDAADEWRVLLTALAQPHRQGLVRTVGCGVFVGWSADAMARGEHDVDRLQALVRRCSTLLVERGVEAMFETLTTELDVVARILGTDGGERLLTDLRHVAASLHEVARREQLGVQALLEWLQQRIAEAADDQSAERSRRLESDAAAVQVVTVHSSKGLEFPIVHVPFLWSRYVPRDLEVLTVHDGPDRVLDVGGADGPAYASRRARHDAEDDGESLRLAYVALTRASSQVVTWWAPSTNTPASPLHRLLFGQRADDGTLPARVDVPDDVGVFVRMNALAHEAGGCIAVEPAGPDPVTWVPPASTVPDPVLSRFGRRLDEAWSRTSYTRLTSGLHDHGGPDDPPTVEASVGSEADDPGTVDEPDLGPLESESGGAGADLPSPMAGLPAGAGFGTLVHDVLERLDPTADDLLAATTAAAEAAGAYAVAGLAPTELAAALQPSLLTPLGPLADDRRLADLRSTDRLPELDFELPLAGGDEPTGGSRLRGIAGLLRRHLADDDPVAAYADALEAPELGGRALRGFLTGSIDAVLRVGTADAPRFVVVDYKTNRLGGTDETTAWHYRPDAVATAMREAHYPLQAMLYSVALHRFLRWRVRAYDPEQHLGGVLYLFLRGMCGPATPVVDGVAHGVFSWRPPAGLVTDLSDLLAGGGTA